MADKNIGNDPITDGKDQNNVDNDLQQMSQLGMNSADSAISAGKTAKRVIDHHKDKNNQENQGDKRGGDEGLPNDALPPSSKDSPHSKTAGGKVRSPSEHQTGEKQRTGNDQSDKESDANSPVNDLVSEDSVKSGTNEGETTGQDSQRSGVTDQADGDNNTKANKSDSKNKKNEKNQANEKEGEKKQKGAKNGEAAAGKGAEKAAQKTGEKAGEKAGEKGGEVAVEGATETAGTAAGGLVGKLAGKAAGKVVGKLVIPAIKLLIVFIFFFTFAIMAMVDSLPSYIYNGIFDLREDLMDQVFIVKNDEGKDVPISDPKSMYTKSLSVFKTDYTSKTKEGGYNSASIDMLFLFSSYSISMDQYEKDTKKEGDSLLSWRWDMLIKLVLAFPDALVKSVATTVTGGGSGGATTPTDTGGGDYTTGSLTQLVNKSHAVGAGYEPTDLVALSDTTVRTVLLRSEAASAYEKMQSDAASGGINFCPNSGYRSYETQSSLYENSDKSKNDTAKPGESEHQLGLAIDVTCSEVSYDVVESFEETSAGKYLKDNAYKYGFILRYMEGKESVTGYVYEPWHFRYVGVETATAIHNSGQTMEEYYAQKSGTGTGTTGGTTGGSKTTVTSSEFKKEWIFSAFFGKNAKITDKMPGSQYTYEEYITYMVESMKKDLGIENGMLSFGSGAYYGAFAWPVDKPLADFVFADDDDYGWRVHPIWGDLRWHDGLDLSGAYGLNVYAAADGTVSFAGNEDGYGNKVVIQHSNGISTLYGHNQSISVKSGDAVKKGQLIAYMGSSGDSTGPHLHFGAFNNGTSFDPLDLYKSSLVGNDNMEKIWNYLTKTLGCTPQAAAGIMGNMWKENTTFEPSMVQDGGNGNGYGICQWDDRRGDLFAFAAFYGYDVNDLYCQLEFLRCEVSGNPSVDFPGFNHCGAEYNSFSGTWDTYKTMTDVSAAAVEFHKYERSSDSSMDMRINYANEVFKMYGNK